MCDKRVSTTEKGDAFEDVVFCMIRDEIKSGRFWATAESCKVFQKKGYFSKDRDDVIVFDISIEIFIPGSESIAVLCLIECKDYNSTVPASDIEEFYAKTQQIAGESVKPIMAITSTIQRAGLAYAQSKGMGVLKFVDPGNFHWQLHRNFRSVNTDTLESYQLMIESAVLFDRHQFESFSWYGIVKEQCTVSLRRFFGEVAKDGESELMIQKLQTIKTSSAIENPALPYIQSAELENTSLKVLNEIGYQEGSVNLDLICELLRETAGLDYSIVLQPYDADVNVLGCIQFDPFSITLYTNDELSDRRRMRFTLAHELGHYYLDHSKFIKREKTLVSDFEVGGTYPSKLIQKMEIQANYFASKLLMPLKPFIRESYSIIQKLGIVNRGQGPLYVDHQPSNRHNLDQVLMHLSDHFDVSRLAAKYRLRNVGLLNDVTAPKRVKDLIDRALNDRAN